MLKLVFHGGRRTPGLRRGRGWQVSEMFVGPTPGLDFEIAPGLLLRLRPCGFMVVEVDRHEPE